MKLFRKSKSKYYWYDFTVRGERYRGSTKETNETRAAKAAVTVWQNAVAPRKLPSDLFKGEMDAWYECSDGRQMLTFTGERRRSLGVDDRG